MCIGEEFCGRDSDEVFSYMTLGQVRIKDRRLGLLRYSMLILIVLYIGFYNIFFQKGWAKISEPDGTVRLKAQSPTLDTITKKSG